MQGFVLFFCREGVDIENVVLSDKYVLGACPRLVNYGKWVLKPYLFKLVVFLSFKETKLNFVRR